MNLKNTMVALLATVLTQPVCTREGQTLERRLFDAITQSDDATVAALLKDDNRVNINATNFSRQTPLIYAARLGSPEAVVTLIAHGAALDATDALGQTALLKASTQGRKKIMRMLLEAGADPNIADHSGQTALMKAIPWGKLDTVYALLAYDADPNAQDNIGHTALTYAAKYNLPTLIQELVLWGAKMPENAPSMDERALALIEQAQTFDRSVITNMQGLLENGYDLPKDLSRYLIRDILGKEWVEDTQD